MKKGWKDEAGRSHFGGWSSSGGFHYRNVFSEESAEIVSVIGQQAICFILFSGNGNTVKPNLVTRPLIRKINPK